MGNGHTLGLGCGPRLNGQLGNTVFGVVAGGLTHKLLRIGTLRAYADQPSLLQVTLAAVSQDDEDDWALNARPFADLRWTSGGASVVEARVDIPAFGTSFTVGGSDGLSVEVGIDGDSTQLFDITGFAAIARGASPRSAQRTLRNSFAGSGDSTRQRIPNFARSVRFAHSAPTGNANLAIDFYNEPTGGTLLARECVGSEIRIPNGAVSFALDGTLEGATTTVHTIWELSL